MTIIAEFSIDYIQYLNPEGEPTQPLPQLAQDLKTLLDLYRWMVLVRTFDAKAIALQRTGKLGTFAASLGQEAVSVGIGHALRKDDVFVPYYRDQGTFMMRGIKPALLFAYWGGDERGNDFNTSKEDLPIAVPISTQFPQAAGIAYAIKYRRENRAVLTLCGDGGTSEGDFYEGMNFAGLFKLPVVFLINNNQWAISVARDKQTATATLAQKAIAAGFNGIQVDGNDVIAVAHTVQESLAKARAGNGPTLIEAVNYRLCDHTTADDARRYTSKEALDHAWQCEPLLRLRKYLTTQNVLSTALEEEIQAQCTDTIAQAVDEYVNMPPQPPTAIIDYMFAHLPDAYRQQRNEIEKLTITEGH